jgi:hypothetical protein
VWRCERAFRETAAKPAVLADIHDRVLAFLRRELN